MGVETSKTTTSRTFAFLSWLMQINPLRSTPRSSCKTVAENTIETSRQSYEVFLRRGVQQVELRLESDVCPRETVRSFEVLGLLGEGSFGKVVVVKYLKDGEKYAMKIQNKVRIQEQKMVPYVIREKKLLYASANVFLIELKFSAQDAVNVYLVMELSPFGDFYRCVVAHKSLSEKRARIYSAQIVLGLEYLHNCNILYRDLKPDNILVFRDGYLKLSDFGFAKRITNYTYTFCGTLDYMAPELLLSLPYKQSVDWWALGVVIYEMLIFENPFVSFFDLKEELEYNILRQPVKLPDNSAFSRDLEDLIFQLLQKQPSHRLGTLTGGVGDIKEHPWFKEINFVDVYLKKYEVEKGFEITVPKPVNKDGIFGNVAKSTDSTDGLYFPDF